MRSYILVTNNSEKYIYDTLCSLLPLEEGEELIIFDNHSTDQTVPIIVSTVGIMWRNEEQYKFYINTKKETNKATLEKALSIAKYEPIVVKKKSRFKIRGILKNDKNK